VSTAKTAPHDGVLSVRPGLNDTRYGAVSIVLHWTIAILILVQIGLGLYMNHVLPDHSPAQARIETLHISIGLTTFLLILIRVGVRLTHPAPRLPQELELWERVLARASHWLFYILMLALPLTGWAMVSMRKGPVEVWGMGWPRLPPFGGMPAQAHKPLHHALQSIHTDWLVWIAIANLLLHVAGALKHQFDGHPVLWRMLPIVGPKPERIRRG
jgi:cytochrome b561